MKKYYALILMSAIFLTSIFAQSGIVKKADKLYYNFDFTSALEEYKKADSHTPDDMYVKSRIGNCYRLLSKIGEAESWYSQVAVADGTENIYKFYYAQSLMANAKYQEALNMFNVFYDSEGNPELKISNLDQKLFQENEQYTVEIGAFNTKYSDFSPLRIKDQLFFVSNRQSDVLKSRQDVWSSRPYTKIYNVDLSEGSSRDDAKLYNTDLSQKYHEGSMSWDRSRNDLYITRSNQLKKKIFMGEDKDVNLKIYKIAFVAEQSDFGEMLVDNVSFDDVNFSIAHPAITADGKYMIFSSNMPGGFGGMDLYVAEHIDGIWSNALNLGGNINSPGNDAFPYIMPDGLLYFSSDGHLGLGGYDIFSTELNEEGAFDIPQNLKAPINSQSDDFGFWMNDNYSEGFFTSNRPSIYGDDDIYSFEKKAFNFEAVIYDSKTEEKIDSCEVVLTNVDTKEETYLYTNSDGYVVYPIEPFSNYNVRIVKAGYLPEEASFSTIDDEVYAEIPLVKDFGIVLEVTVVDADTKKEIPAAEILLTDLGLNQDEVNNTNSYGKTLLMLDENKQYRLKSSKATTGDEVYLAVSKDFNTYDVVSPATLYTTLELKKVKKGAEIKIDNIYYDVNKYFIRDDAKPELNKLIKVLNDNPNMEIELASHTDCRGTKGNNAKLSAKRAEAAVNYLIESGINYRRLTATGYGETKVINGCVCEGTVRSNCTKPQHQANRRTIFSIVKF